MKEKNKLYPIPPAEMFMNPDAATDKPKDGVSVRLAPGWVYSSKKLTKKILKVLYKNGY